MKALIIFILSLTILSCVPIKHTSKPQLNKPKYSIVFHKIDTTYWNGRDSITFTKEIIIDYTLDLRTLPRY
jgi:hypothetical protein